MTTNRRRTPGQVLARRTLKKVRRYKLWNCSSCGTEGINANTCDQCPQCGNNKDLDDRHEKEYRSATPVNDNYKHRGADISCQYCGSENERRFSCWSCGAALDKKFEKQVGRFPLKSDHEWREHTVQVERSGFVPDATKTPWNDGASPEPPPTPLRPSISTRVRGAEQKAVRAAVSLREPEVRRDPRTWFVIAGLCVALTIMLMVAVWAYRQYTTLTGSMTEVAGVSWSYSLPLEDYAPRDKTHTTADTDWKPPIEAIEVKSKRVVVDTEDIIEDVWTEKTCTKTEDNSYDDTDGTWVELIEEVDVDCSGYVPTKTGERDIMGNAWTYQLYEWQETTPLTAGDNSHTVQLPIFVPTDTLRASEPAVTKFIITFSYTDHDGDVNQATRQVARPLWESVAVGQTFPAIIDGFGTLRAIAQIDDAYEKLSNH